MTLELCCWSIAKQQAVLFLRWNEPLKTVQLYQIFVSSGFHWPVGWAGSAPITQGFQDSRDEKLESAYIQLRIAPVDLHIS